MTDGTAMLEKSLTTFLDAVAEKTSAPGGGAVSAIVVAMAAALAGMAARFSEKQLGEEAEGFATRADVLRAEVGPLAQADAEAYGAYLAARRLPESDPGREAALAEAGARSAEVPLRIAELGAEVGAIADELLAHGNPHLEGDAFASRNLAAAATRAAASLVVINLEDESDERVRRARELLR
jgi:methenyltetrahydrofolate cyclohydrolase